MRPPEHTGGSVPGNQYGELAPLGEALAWLDRHVNLEKIERGIAGRSSLPTLERIGALAQAMGDPQDHLQAIHITGTNGKGSTSALCTALLRASGLFVGTYTSPDLERLNERICVDGIAISDAELADELLAMRALERFVMTRDAGSLAPTWFELVTATAFRYFSNRGVDAGVIEVGIGGLWDATNIIEAEVAVVTNVELDHTEILGSTRAEIATEKAGIIKEGSVVVIGEQDEELARIFHHRALEVGAAGFLQRGDDFACVENRVALGGRLVDLRTIGGEYEEIFLPLHGAHQGENAAIALASAEAFFGGPLDRDVVEEAFGQTTVPGRLEVAARRPLVVLDGAHNAAGAGALGVALREDFSAQERIIVVMGCLRGRDPSVLLDALGTERVVHVVACRPPSPRALDPESVAGAAKDLGISASVVPDATDALKIAREMANEDDLILVTGSLYTVGFARQAALRLGSVGP